MAQAVSPGNRRYLTVRDIAGGAVVTNDILYCPTQLISIENTSSGIFVPLTMLRGTHAWARAEQVKMYIDGARLRVAVASGGGRCQKFSQFCDVLSLDFNKNLGVPMGAMTMGSAKAIRRTAQDSKESGGGMRAAGVMTMAAPQAVSENFGLGQEDTRGVLRRSHELARRVAEYGRRRAVGRAEVEANMVWLDLMDTGHLDRRVQPIGREARHQTRPQEAGLPPPELGGCDGPIGIGHGRGACAGSLQAAGRLGEAEWLAGARETINAMPRRLSEAKAPFFKMCPGRISSVLYGSAVSLPRASALAVTHRFRQAYLTETTPTIGTIQSWLHGATSKLVF